MRGSTWILGPAPAPAGRSPASTAATPPRPTVAAMSGRGSNLPVGVGFDRAGQAGRGAENADRGDVLERERAGVDEAGAPGDAHVHHTFARFHELERPRGQGWRVGGVDHGVEGQRGQRAGRPRAGEAQGLREAERPGRPAHQVHFGPGRPGEHRDQQPDRPRAQDEHPVVRAQPGSLGRAEGVAARLDQGAERGVDRGGQGVQRGDGHGELFGERTGAPAADAQLLPGFADMLVSAPAAAAGAAAEHGVAGDPAADPGRVNPLAGRRDGPGPLVAEPDRELGVAVVEVGHLAGEELDIGPAHPGPLDVDDGLAGPRDGRGDLLDAGLPRGGDHEGPHRCGAHRPDDVMGR